MPGFFLSVIIEGGEAIQVPEGVYSAFLTCKAGVISLPFGPFIVLDCEVLFDAWRPTWPVTCCLMGENHNE
jgi:hypothetical protein